MIIGLGQIFITASLIIFMASEACKSKLNLLKKMTV